jgi:D-alanyl-D-alanine carboxypeptidase
MLRNYKILLCLFLSLRLSNASAQSASPTLDSLLNATLDSMQNAMNAKSLSASIQFSNSINWAHASGISSINPTVNVTNNDVFLICGVGITITAASILQLADWGVLNLDDSLHEWLDTFQYVNPNITIRQLLRHQSGLYDIFSNPGLQPAMVAKQDSIWSAENLIITFVNPPLFAPGTNWSFTNTGYLLLGMIIEEATGFFFYQDLRSRFFTPLGMNSIAIPAYETLLAPNAHVWIDFDGDGITEDADYFFLPYLSLNSAAGAVGGYYATPSEISKWMWTYMRGDLHSATIMNEAKLTVASPGFPGTTYGLGLMKKTFYGYQGYGHGGDLAYAATSWYFPLKDISVSVFTNDSQKNSWMLVPVVNALLKTYSNNQNLISTAYTTKKEQIKITSFPNPFSSSVRVELNEPALNATYLFVLKNILGEEVARIEKQVESKESISISLNNLDLLSSGMFSLSVFENNELMQTVKLAKQ